MKKRSWLIFLLILMSGLITNAQTETENDWFEVKLSVPEFNSLYLNKGTHYGLKNGYLGLSFGFVFPVNGLIYKFQAGFTDTHPDPLPSQYDPGPYDPYSDVLGQFISFQAGNKAGRLRSFLGIQFNQTNYSKREIIFSSDTTVIQSSTETRNLGWVASCEYRLNENFSLGFNYYPSLIAVSDRFRVHYSHLAFIEFIFTFEGQ